MAENTLFVLGNGFDLAHQLPTSYIDFFVFIESIVDRIRGGSSVLQSIYQQMSDSDSLTEIWKYVVSSFRCGVCLSDSFISEIISVLRLYDQKQENVWHGIFRSSLASNTYDMTWIDFESEIRDTACFIDNPPHTSNDDYLYTIGPVLKRERDCYPQSVQNSIRRFNSNPSSKNLSLLKKDLAFYLHEELVRYAYCFELYLSFYALDPNRIPSRLSFFRALFSNSSKGASGKENFILSFNYTDTVERVYSRTIPKNVLSRTHHIHGKIRSPEELEAHFGDEVYNLEHSPIVLGFKYSGNADENPDDCTPFIWFEKFYQRILKRTGTEIYDWLEKKHPYENRSDEFNAVFYGHSMDSTDSDLIQKIFHAAKHIDVYYYGEANLPEILYKLTKSLGRETIERNYTGGKISFKLASSVHARDSAPESTTTPSSLTAV